jgi:hypothetical protein
MIAEVSAKSKVAELIEGLTLDLAGRSATPAKGGKRSLLALMGKLSAARKN